MTTLTHDGYLAELEIDEGAGAIHGRVINARAVLTFEGETLADLKSGLRRYDRRLSGVVQRAWQRTGKALFRDALIAHRPGASPPRRRTGREGGGEHQSIHLRTPRRSGVAKTRG